MNFKPGNQEHASIFLMFMVEISGYLIFFRPAFFQGLGKFTQHQELDDPSEDISEILADDSSNESSLVSGELGFLKLLQLGTLRMYLNLDTRLL